MQVALTVSEVDGDGAMGDVVGGLICMHNGSLYPSFLLRITLGWKHCLRNKMIVKKSLFILSRYVFIRNKKLCQCD